MKCGCGPACRGVADGSNAAGVAWVLAPFAYGLRLGRSARDLELGAARATLPGMASPMSLTVAWSWLRTNAGAVMALFAGVGGLVGGLVGGGWYMGQLVEKVNTLSEQVEELPTTATTVNVEQVEALGAQVKALSEQVEELPTTATTVSVEQVEALGAQVAMLMTTVDAEQGGLGEQIAAVQEMFRPMLTCIVGAQLSVVEAIVQREDMTTEDVRAVLVPEICQTVVDNLKEFDADSQVR